MTALDQYLLLEATGVYFDGETAEGREVIVKFGDATLTFMAFDETPLAHWSLATLRRLPTTMPAPGELRLVPDFDSEERLTLVDRDMIAAIRSVCPQVDAAPKTDRRGARRLAFWGVGAVAAVLLVVFVIAPSIAGQLARAIPPSSEIALGETVSERVLWLLSRSGGAEVCDGGRGGEAMDRMVARLMERTESHLPIRVRVIDDAMINAFAMPGGQIFVMRGLIDGAGGPEEVAGVLAHEIGHVVNRDPTREALRTAGTAGILGLLLGDFTGGGAIVAISETMLTVSYTRRAEEMADQAANGILARAGLPSAPLAAFFERLQDKFGDVADGPFSYLATHPGLAARRDAALAADTIGDTAFAPALADHDWRALRNICE